MVKIVFQPFKGCYGLFLGVFAGQNSSSNNCCKGVSSINRETYNTRLRFQVIREVKNRLGFSKVREIARNLGRSASGIHYQLQKLVSEGIVKKIGSSYVWFDNLRNRSVLNTARKKLGFSKNVDGDGRISNKAQVDRALEEIRSVVGKIPAWFFGIGGPKSCFN